MIPLRLCLAGAATVVALGGGTAFAAPALMASVSHGDSVSAAVAACSHSAGSARGACASAAAAKADTGGRGESGDSTNGSKPEASPDNAHGMAVSAAAKSCAHGTASDRDAHGDCVSAVARDTATHTGGR